MNAYTQVTCDKLQTHFCLNSTFGDSLFHSLIWTKQTINSREKSSLGINPINYIFLTVLWFYDFYSFIAFFLRKKSLWPQNKKMMNKIFVQTGLLSVFIFSAFKSLKVFLNSSLSGVIKWKCMLKILYKTQNYWRYLTKSSS